MTGEDAEQFSKNAHTFMDDDDLLDSSASSTRPTAPCPKKGCDDDDEPTPAPKTARPAKDTPEKVQGQDQPRPEKPKKKKKLRRGNGSERKRQRCQRKSNSIQWQVTMLPKKLMISCASSCQRLRMQLCLEQKFRSLMSRKLSKTSLPNLRKA